MAGTECLLHIDVFSWNCADLKLPQRFTRRAAVQGATPPSADAGRSQTRGVAR
jgi:hypothetical protein